MCVEGRNSLLISRLQIPQGTPHCNVRSAVCNRNSWGWWMEFQRWQ